jgi:hypothetical protein
VLPGGSTIGLILSLAGTFVDALFGTPLAMSGRCPSIEFLYLQLAVRNCVNPVIWRFTWAALSKCDLPERAAIVAL